jgi:hypothetical protein
MQFNLVVSTNVVAVELWKKHGFNIVGTIPKSFEHPEKGLVECQRSGVRVNFLLQRRIIPLSLGKFTLTPWTDENNDIRY